MASKSWVYIIVIVAVLVIAGFFLFRGPSNTPGENPTPPGETPAWMTIELTDVNSGESFTLSQFDKPVLLESFAVWCPTCTKQQNEVKKLHLEPGFSEEDVISISLDTDPNEDTDKVRQHSQSNGYNWRYSVSPISLTEMLIDEFGPVIVNAPSVPVVLICPNGNFNKLSGLGVKDVNEMKDAIATCQS